MALNFNQSGPASTVKAALDALPGLSDDEVIVRGHASDALATYGDAEVMATVQTMGWKVIRTEVDQA